uniref:Nonribosomal peptide synthetase fso1 n=1 Tax=Omphalotus olearius TaxID=72120 RepID=FSO1_OMPOL|nr:RecName: Full=Nonribosomal peptide synthase fso1; AltName: Full=Ferrichrome A biosynthesis cluster protein fso1; AltName: Full=Ferrichrome A synthetase [Omphalotus olearius]AAX49356.1 putative peptide synthetase [Omphalotus olearius]
MSSLEGRFTLPATCIPCVFPRVISSTLNARLDVITINSPESKLDLVAFATVLRALLATSGEFSFGLGKNQFVVVESVDETEKEVEEKLSVHDASQVTGSENVQARIDSDALEIDGSVPSIVSSSQELVLFHLNAQPSSVSLVYSTDYIPDSLAKSLLELYFIKCAAKFDIGAISGALSIVNHPVQSVLSNRKPLLHAAFVERADETPDALAIDYLSAIDEYPLRKTLSYGDLDKYSLAVARILRGIVPSTEKAIVPLALPPSPELYIGYLATLRAGYAFCPLPGCDAAPVERIRELITDVSASVVLGLGSRPPWLADLGHIRWVDISLEADNFALKSASLVDGQDWVEPEADDLAYVLFTSGSTGKPKGVQITHLAAASSIAGHLAVRPLPPYTRWFQFAASTFDPSLMETFMNLSSGTTICAANRQRLLTDPESVLCELECTHMMATPSFAAMLRPERLGNTASKSFLEHGVKFELWTMGERLLEKVIAAFSRPDEGYVLCNAYGPTEAAINTTLRVHPRHETGARLGQPIPSATMVILHPTEPWLVPQGFPGELGLAGPQLARGYLNMPDQTARAFVLVDGIGRVYRTGDKARLVPDSNNEWTCVEYLGRMGLGQVKLSGRRVELGEIDVVMASVPGVQSAHAIVHQQSGNGAVQLVAFLTPDDEKLVEKVKAVVDARLPQHMRPSRYFLGESVPRSTSGKADRRAIGAVIASRIAQSDADNRTTDTEGEIVADREMLERIIKIVAETVDVLDNSAVTPISNLFDLGIDSLRGVRLLSLAREAGIQGLTIKDLLQNATPIALVNALCSRQNDADSSQYLDTLLRFTAEAAPAVRRELSLSDNDPLPPILPATPMQAGVLALYLRGGPASKGYINHSVYKLASGIDLDRFKDSWVHIVQRNDILHSRFVLVDNSATSPFAMVTLNDASVSWVERTGDDVEALVETYLKDIPSDFSLTSLKAFALLKNADGSDVRFVLSLHHSISDGASLALMLEELSLNYRGNDVSLRREGFEHSVKDALTADTDANTSYWKEQLEDFTPDAFPDLTGLRPSAKYTGHHVTTVISSMSFSNLLKTSRALKSTPLAVLQAAWASILLAYSESESPDIVFGSIVGGRSSEALEYTVGPVFTAVPVRVRNVSGVTTGDLLSTFVSNNVQGLVHRYPPVSVLSGSSGIIYDTTIALQHFGQEQSQTALWTAADYPAMETEFAVVLEVWPEEDDSIRLRATCSNHVLIPSASEAMLHQFDDILKFILENPAEAQFANVTDGVRQRLQSSINSHPQPFPVAPNTLIHHEFEQNARLHPDALAIWFKEDIEHPENDIRWTYRELNEKANRLAHLLASTYGNLCDRAIPLCMEKCPELYVAILGVLKAGAAWCPVDFAAPEMRKQNLFARAGGPVVLISSNTEFSHIKAALPGGLDIFSLDDPRLNDQPDSAPVIETTPSHLAYLIWTSGTTGLPKGVPIEHKAAVQSLKVLQREIPHNTAVRCLNFSAYTFDVSVLDVFYALGSACGTLCSSRKEILVGKFAEAVNAFEATQAFLTPAFMTQSSLDECRTLESLISIGEKLPDTVADKWCRPGTASLNTYGPAESTIIATYRRFTPNDSTKAHNVGLPIQTVSCFAMKEGRIVPRGAVGELALGGYQNARGYHRQPDMTAKKFIEHPTAGSIYLTGDIVRFLHDGTCEFVGRNDDLVKLGGIRVELSEISAALESCHPAVHEAVTIQLSRPDRPQKIVCTFVAAPGISGDKNICIGTDAVEIACAAKERAELSLPVFMHPNVVIIVKRLPHTASNKIDRKALGEYYCDLDIMAWENSLADHMGTGDIEATWSETELKIRDTVSELTGSPKEWISKTTHLPALGVDSIRALQLASRLRAIDVNISVQDILQHSTIRQLARQSETASSNLHNVISPWLEGFSSRWSPVVQRDFVEKVERVLPCAPLQEGMLGESVKNPEAYWSHRLFPLNKNIDLGRLSNAWNTATEHYEILRVVFMPAAAYASSNVMETDPNSVFLQVLLSRYEVPSTRQQIGRSEVYSMAREYARNIAISRSRSLQPRWSLIVLESTDGHSWMMFSMHHALYDAHAVTYLLADIQRRYHGISPSPQLQLTSALSRTFFANGPQESLDVWRDILTPFADRNALEWPTLTDGRSREDARFFSSAFERDYFSLTELATKAGGTAGHVLQAAWSIVSAAYLETDRVVFGETLSLRLEDHELQHAIAPLITTKPVAAHLKGTTTPRVLIRELADLTKLASLHRSIGFQHIRKILQRPINQPLFPSIFVIYFEEDSSVPSDIAENLWSSPHDVSSLGVEHPIAINVNVSGEKVVVNVLGNGAIMSESQVELLSQQFNAVLTRMLNEPDVPIMSLVSALDEMHLSIVKGASPMSQTHPLHWLEKFALTRPDAVAVSSYRSLSNEVPNEIWTYRALEEASNRVAHWIRRRYHSGIVAFCMPRSHTSIVYQLGIFKSGNIYLPIGEEIPAFRKRLIFRTSQTSLVFTTKALLHEFKSLDKNAIICVDDVQHLLEVSDSAITKPPLSIPETSCILVDDGHLCTSRASLVSSQNLISMVEGFVHEVYSSVLSLDENIFLSWMPSSADIHLIELFAPLRMGMKSASIPHQFLHQDASAVFHRTGASHSFLTTLGLNRRFETVDLPSVKCAIFTGIPSRAALLKEWRNGQGLMVLRAFGFPGLFTLGQYEYDLPMNIGKPVNSCTTLVLRQDSSAITLRGEAGELCIAEDILSPQYSKAHVFTDTVGYGRVHRTRHVGRVRADDTIDYNGPINIYRNNAGQVIDLTELSELLRSTSHLSIDVATFVFDHPEGIRNYIVSFVSRSSSADPLNGALPVVVVTDFAFTSNLLGHYKRHVSAHLVPDFIIPLDYLPLSSLATGRKHEARLKRVFHNFSLSALNQGSEKKRSARSLTAVEEEIRAILSKTTGIPVQTIDADSTTIELGIDSLSAISLSYQLKSAGYFVPPHVILSGPSVAKLGKSSKAIVESNTKVLSSWEVEDSIKKFVCEQLKVEVQSVLPCLPLQEGLIAHTLNSAKPIYVNHFVLRLDEADPMLLRAAFEETVKANDILRTCFVAANQNIVQAVLSETPEIWRSVSVESQEDLLSKLRHDMAGVEHDVVQNLGQKPPIRLGLYLSDSSPTYFCLTMHHAVYDGQSLSMLLSEVRDRYTGCFQIQRGSTSNFLNYLARQSQDASRAFYSDYLHNIPRPPVSPFVDDTLSSHHQSLKLDVSLSHLERISRSVNASLHSLALAAFGVATAEYRKRNDLVIGVVLSGRSVLVDGIETMLAPCITTVPVRVRTGKSEVFSDIAQRIHTEMSSLLAYQHTPLRLIQRWLGSSEPLFDTLFSFNRMTTGSSSSTLWSSVESKAALDYPFALAIDADSTSDSLVIRAGHIPSFGSKATVKTIMLRVAELLANLDTRIDLLVSHKLLETQEDSPMYDSSAWSQEEILIRNNVAEVCNVDRNLVTKDISFLHLGIDSITSIRLAQQLRNAGLAIPTFAIMRHPCVGALAEYLKDNPMVSTSAIALRELNEIQEVLRKEYGDSIPRLAAEDEILSLFPATPLQTGMLSQTIYSGGRLYMVHHSLQLDINTVSLERLRNAWEVVVASTDILRCSFHVCPSGDYPWLAAIHSKTPLRWKEYDVPSTSVLRLIAFQIENTELIKDESGFATPPLSLHLINSPDMCVLIISMHHCLYDGLSLAYILEDVTAAYFGHEAVRRPQFTDAVPFVLYSSKDRAHFWQKRLSGFSASPIPKRQPEGHSPNLASQFVDLPDGSLDAIKEMGVLVQATALLAWGKTLAALTGSLDVVFGQVVAGRAIELDNALLVNGPLFNTVPFRFTISDPSWSNAEGVQAQHAFNIAAEPHSHVPLRTIQAEWRSQNMSRDTLFDTLFVFQQGKGPSMSSLWTRFNVSDDASASQYPLSLEIIHTNNKIELRAGCQAGIMSQTELQDLLRLLHDTLLDIVVHPTANILDQSPSLKDLHTVPQHRAPSAQEGHSKSPGRALTVNEETLRDVFSSVTKIPKDQIGLETPLYALGLDSVGAIQVAAKCRIDGLNITVVDIFAGETIAGICKAYETRDIPETGTLLEPSELVSSNIRDKALALLNLEQESVQEVLPVLAGQSYHLGAWLACGGISYEPVFAYRAAVPLDPERLRKAWNALRSQHGILRTSFAATSPDEVVQVVLKQLPDSDPSWSFVEVEGDFDQRVREQARIEYSRPSTLFRPPARARLVRVGNQDALLLVFHHATYDAWSIPLLVRDLCALYDGLHCKSTSNFTGLVQYLHTTSDKGSQATFWRDSLDADSGVRPTILPTTSPSSGLKQVFVRVPGVVSSVDQLSNRCQTAGVGLQALVLAVWGRVCQNLIRSTSAPILGVYHTGRAASFDGLGELAGPTVNVLPMRVPVASPGKIWDVAKQIQRDLGRRTAFEHSSLREIMSHVGHKNGPLFNVFVNLLWHGDKIRTIRQDSLLSSLSIGPPTDYAPDKPFALKSSVNALDHSHLPKFGLYIDVVLDSKDQSLAVAARCHEALLNKEQLRSVVDSFGDGVVDAIGELE